MNQGFQQVEMEPVYGFFHYLSGVLYDIGFRGEVAGVENLPQQGSFVIAANHASYLDPFLVGTQVQRQIAFFARKTLWKPGFASWWLDAVGTIPVDRDGGQALSAIKRVLRALKDDRALIFFPEGTRTSDGNLQMPKPGVGMIACTTQVPVVPVRIFGSYEAMGKGQGLRLGTPISIVFGPPLPPSVYDDPAAGKERYQVASSRIMERIAALRKPVVQVI